MAVKFDIRLEATPLKLIVWDAAASEAVGQVIAEEVRTQARKEASGVNGPFPRGAKGQRVTLTDTGYMLDSLHAAKVTDRTVEVESRAEYSPYVDAAYPHMGISTKTEVALLSAIIEQSTRAFLRAQNPDESKIMVDKQGRVRDRKGRFAR